MFDSDNDSELKDMILQSLIEKMEDIMGDKMKPEEKGMSVEVAAPDKAALQEGLEKAGDVLDKAPAGAMIPSASPDDDGKSDDERLAELVGESGDDEEDDKDRI